MADIDIALGQVVEIAWGQFRQHVTNGYRVVDEKIRWTSKPAPEMRFTVQSTADEAKCRVVDWIPLRIWRSTHGNEWEIHVSDGKGKQVSTGRMTGPGPNVILNPDRDAGKYGAVIHAAARLMASHVNNEILRLMQ